MDADFLALRPPAAPSFDPRAEINRDSATAGRGRTAHDELERPASHPISSRSSRPPRRRVFRTSSRRGRGKTDHRRFQAGRNSHETTVVDVRATTSPTPSRRGAQRSPIPPPPELQVLALVAKRYDGPSDACACPSHGWGLMGSIPRTRREAGEIAPKTPAPNAVRSPRSSPTPVNASRGVCWGCLFVWVDGCWFNLLVFFILCGFENARHLLENPTLMCGLFGVHGGGSGPRGRHLFGFSGDAQDVSMGWASKHPNPPVAGHPDCGGGCRRKALPGQSS